MFGNSNSQYAEKCWTCVNVDTLVKYAETNKPNDSVSNTTCTSHIQLTLNRLRGSLIRESSSSSNKVDPKLSDVDVRVGKTSSNFSSAPIGWYFEPMVKKFRLGSRIEWTKNEWICLTRSNWREKKIRRRKNKKNGGYQSMNAWRAVASESAYDQRFQIMHQSYQMVSKRAIWLLAFEACGASRQKQLWRPRALLVSSFRGWKATPQLTASLKTFLNYQHEGKLLSL